MKNNIIVIVNVTDLEMYSLFQVNLKKRERMKGSRQSSYCPKNIKSLSFLLWSHLIYICFNHTNKLKYR